MILIIETHTFLLLADKTIKLINFQWFFPGRFIIMLIKQIFKIGPISFNIMFKYFIQVLFFCTQLYSLGIRVRSKTFIFQVSLQKKSRGDKLAGHSVEPVLIHCQENWLFQYSPSAGNNRKRRSILVMFFHFCYQSLVELSVINVLLIPNIPHHI